MEALRRAVLRMRALRARVGTDRVSRSLRCELLKTNGCLPSSRVLEVGCGELHAGIHLIHLAPDGIVLASLRLAEGNPYGDKGPKDGEDTRAEEWSYPGGGWFKHATVVETAGRVGMTARYAHEPTESHTPTRPSESHDGFCFAHVARSSDEIRPVPPPAGRSGAGAPRPSTGAGRPARG